MIGVTLKKASCSAALIAALAVLPGMAHTAPIEDKLSFTGSVVVTETGGRVTLQTPGDNGTGANDWVLTHTVKAPGGG